MGVTLVAEFGGRAISVSTAGAAGIFTQAESKKYTISKTEKVR
jgi:hypothetical protein